MEKKLIKHLKDLILIGAIPVFAFWLAALLAFWFYPNCIEGASQLLIGFVLVGCIVAILLIFRNIFKITKK